MRHTNSLMCHFVCVLHAPSLFACFSLCLQSPNGSSEVVLLESALFNPCQRMHVFAYVCIHINMLHMFEHAQKCVSVFLLCVPRAFLCCSELWAVLGCGLSSISQVWHTRAFCTNTVQWSALHSNPAIMTAALPVCICCCSGKRKSKRQEKEKQHKLAN